MSKQKLSGVYQLENGNWGYRFAIVIDGKRKEKKKIKDEKGKPFKTELQAYKARTEAIAQAKAVSGLPAIKKIKRRTVEEVFKEYCEFGRNGKAFATKRKQDSLWNNYLLDRFGERYIDDISVAEINDYLEELYNIYNFAYGYVEGFLKQFYLIFGQAYSRNYLCVDDYNKLCVNKNTKIKMPAIKSTDIKEIVAYTREELKIMDEYFRGKQVETAYMIGKCAGLRVSECYGVTWDNIDFEQGTILVEKQMKLQDGVNRLLPLKTKNARRRVYMNTELQSYLKDLRERTKEYEIEYKRQREQNEMYILDVNNKKVSSLTLVNTLPNGKIQTEHAIRHHARPLRERHQIEFKFHNLRHTYGTNLALLNTPEHILSNQMGHFKAQTTHKYYLAVSKDGINELRNNLEKMCN